MPQKQPPARTAVCSDLAVASVASAAGLGTAARSPALQATTPTRVIINSRADTRAWKLDIGITNSFNRSRVGSRTKVTDIAGGAPGVPAGPAQPRGRDGRARRPSLHRA